MIRIPVYFDLNGIHQIAIFEETEDGTFRRTTEQPMRLLRDNITGIGAQVGELVTPRSDREQRVWATPTVLYRHRAYSFYQFMREQVNHRKIYVFARPSMSGRMTRLGLHELQLKPSASAQVVALLCRKIVESVDLDLEHETQQQDERSSGSVA
jgi:hypothetical protein